MVKRIYKALVYGVLPQPEDFAHLLDLLREIEE